ncbi:MAG: PKD domain-containing protein, partial [Bdellovibrionales bacterium]|nr:PKD domain-containing protein [Bdellovibrionales bacterium]
NIASSGKIVAWGSGSSFDTGSAHYAEVSFQNIKNSNPLPFVHEDDKDPVSVENWGGTSERLQITTQAIDDNGVKAWTVYDNASYINGAKNYWNSLTDSQISELMSEGWTMSARLKIVSACDSNSSESCFDQTDFAVATWLDAGAGKRFAMIFGRLSNGNPEIKLLTGSTSSGTTGPSYVVTNSTANDYHLYELVYDPSTQTADLYVDSSEDPVIENYAGWNLSTAGKRFTWGSGSSFDTGSANYSFVELKPNTVINEPPTAVAGDDQSIHTGDEVSLNGSDSFDDQTASEDLIYTWSFTSQPSGSTATLSDSGSITPSFTADEPGTYVLELVVTDEGGLSSVADEIIISSENMAPTADAGLDIIVNVDDIAVLDGSGSFDPDGDTITYQWTLTSAPSGSTSSLINSTSQIASIVPDEEGQYVISLVVSDAYSSSVADTMTVTAIGAEYAEDQLMDVSDIISNLPDSDFDAKGHRNSLVNRISDVIALIQSGMLEDARNELESIIERVDGCTLRGSADPKGGGQTFAADYITDCAEQEDAYDILIDALNAIS